MSTNQELAAGLILGILAILWLLPDSQNRAPKFIRLWQAAVKGADPGTASVGSNAGKSWWDKSFGRVTNPQTPLQGPGVSNPNQPGSFNPNLSPTQVVA